MAVRSKEEIMDMIKKLIGEDNSDESLTVIEDVSDTLDAGLSGGEDWKSKYEELDKEWREKYKARFFDKGSEQEEEEQEEEEQEEEDIEIDDLFIEKKGD